MQVNEPAAARLFSGQLQLKMQVLQKGGGALGGGAKARARTSGAAAKKNAATSAGGGGSGQREADDPIDLCSDDDAGLDEEAQTRIVLIKAALHQLNSTIKTNYSLQRGPLNTAVQARIAAKGPRTLQELLAMEVNGLSANMKRQYGPMMAAAIKQADAFLPAVVQGACQVDEFQLDTASIFAAEVRRGGWRVAQGQGWAEQGWVSLVCQMPGALNVTWSGQLCMCDTWGGLVQMDPSGHCIKEVISS